MTCKVTEEQLISFLFNELSEDEKTNLSNHLFTCCDCIERIKELNTLKESWSNPEFLLLTDKFTEKVMGSLPQKKQKILFFHVKKLETVYNFAIAYVATYLFLYFDAINQLPEIVNKFSSIIIEKESGLFLSSVNGITWLDKFYFQVLQFFQ